MSFIGRRSCHERKRSGGITARKPCICTTSQNISLFLALLQAVCCEQLSLRPGIHSRLFECRAQVVFGQISYESEVAPRICGFYVLLQAFSTSSHQDSSAVSSFLSLPRLLSHSSADAASLGNTPGPILPTIPRFCNLSSDWAVKPLYAPRALLYQNVISRQGQGRTRQGSKRSEDISVAQGGSAVPRGSYFSVYEARQVC